MAPVPPKLKPVHRENDFGGRASLQAGPGAGRPATGLPRSTTSESVSEEDIYTCKKRDKGR